MEFIYNLFGFSNEPASIDLEAGQASESVSGVEEAENESSLGNRKCENVCLGFLVGGVCCGSVFKVGIDALPYLIPGGIFWNNYENYTDSTMLARDIGITITVWGILAVVNSIAKGCLAAIKNDENS